MTHENPASFAFRFTQQETGNPKPETLFSEQFALDMESPNAAEKDSTFYSKGLICTG
jgi:hypothetical protein